MLFFISNIFLVFDGSGKSCCLFVVWVYLLWPGRGIVNLGVGSQKALLVAFSCFILLPVLIEPHLDGTLELAGGGRYQVSLSPDKDV